MKRMTMKDVADLAGVSKTTVSHVINETRFVEVSTRSKVLQAMKELGYYPNTVARSLRSGETKTIGMIVPDSTNLFFADIARRIENYGYENGYSVILCNSDNNIDKQQNYINTLISKQVDGVIFISSGESREDLQRLSESEIPIVVADRIVPLNLADVVLINNEEAGYIATKYLIDLGHRRIACITGSSELNPSMRRVEGYRRALSENEIVVPEEYIVQGDFQFQSGEMMMTKLMNLPQRPTAVFVLNDMMAIGAVSAARRLGVGVPDDVSIVGFDDIALASLLYPPLTTMAQPTEEIARVAVELLIQKIAHQDVDHENKKYVLNARLIVRDSTKALGE